MNPGSEGTVCRVCRLGCVDYVHAWELQRLLAEARGRNRIADTLLLLEHPPTYTLGRRTRAAHLLTPRQALMDQGMAVYDVDRGGDVTFHGPGQLVGYPIMSLKDREGGASRYLRAMEEVLILVLSDLGVAARRLSGLTGVWIGVEKVAAMGVKINAHRVTSHGFALNLTTELRYFDHIVPCGLQGKGVTSLSRVLAREVSLSEASDKVARAFGEVFQTTMEEIPARDLLHGLGQSE